LDKCPNKVKEGNLIDSLKITGGFYKEIRRRYLSKQVTYLKKLEAELSESDKTDNNIED
jgi:hypothetical protein